MYNKQYFVYIITNPGKTTLYIGLTNDLQRRLLEHFGQRGKKKTFAGRYYCYNLVYFETHESPTVAIEREKEIKDWKRKKKEDLIHEFNPDWKILNYLFN